MGPRPVWAEHEYWRWIHLPANNVRTKPAHERWTPLC
jgi:hypothetical protein